MSKKRQIDPSEEFSAIFKSAWFYVILAGVIFGIFVWSFVPTWEQKNKRKILTEVEQINSLKDDDMVTAYEKWEKLQSYTKGKKITNVEIKRTLDETRIAMVILYPEIATELELRKQELAEEEKRIASAKEEAESREALRKKYRNVDPSAKSALNSLKKLQAFTEVGVNKVRYSEALGVAWGDVKIFVESAEAQTEYSELAALLRQAINQYKDASEDWGTASLLQYHWKSASVTVSKIDDLLNQ